MTSIGSSNAESSTSLLDKVKARIGGGSIRSILVLLAVCLLLMALLVACSPSSSEPSSAPATTLSGETSAPDGAALLAERCSVCHSTERVTQAHKTADEWDTTVTRMISKGAQLTEAEKSALVDYLATTYGP